MLAGFLQQQRRRSETSTFMHYFAHWGGLGLVPLAILDSSLIPTFGSLDVLVAFLSARQGDLWLYYASMATLGAIIGSYLTYRLGQKMGREWMQRRFGRHRALQVEYALEHWGVGAVFVSTVAPPPFPTSILLFCAGTFSYNLRKFFGAVFFGRTIRYGLLSLIAAHYGRTIVRYMRHPGQHLGLSLSVTFLIVLITVAFLILSKTTPQAEESQPTPSPKLART